MNSRQRGFKRALTLFWEAARRVPAYKDFLKKHKINPAYIKTEADFARLPTTDKANYISRYALEELSWDGKLDSARYISSSSGSTGIPFFWPRGRRQDVIIGNMFQTILEHVFDSNAGRTLFVNSFALGTWIAGLEAYNAVQWSIDKGSRVTIVTPGIEKTEAIALIIRLAPDFDRIVIAGYPPFVKDVLSYGIRKGVPWKRFDMRLLLGGEAVSELWKARVLEMMGKRSDVRSIVNCYGMADSGLVAHETPLCSVLRQCAAKYPNAFPELPSSDQIAGLYQFYPLARYFEVHNGSIILTSDAGLPLIRYDTKDTGGIVEMETAMDRFGPELRKTAKRARVDPQDWRMPFIYLHGRKDLSITFYALNIYVENLKRALETSSMEPRLSGLFIMSVEYNKKFDQRFSVVVELASGVEPSRKLSQTLERDIIASLCIHNSEYAKLYASIGARARPYVRLVRYGNIETLPGRKHKWIKRKPVSTKRARRR